MHSQCIHEQKNNWKDKAVEKEMNTFRMSQQAQILVIQWPHYYSPVKWRMSLHKVIDLGWQDFPEMSRNKNTGCAEACPVRV